MPEDNAANSICCTLRPAVERADDGLLRLYAPAKINLNLLVGPLGADGYHPLDSLVAKVSLYDCLELRLRDDGRLEFSCDGFDCGADSKNLAMLAGQMLAEGRTVPGADILLKKYIPPGGGLGGGSSDAATVLAGLNDLWELGLPADELSHLAGRLGSDVPLFLGPAVARMTGRGEQLAPIDVYPFRAVLILPEVACATAAVYKAFDAAGSTRMPEQLDVHLLTSPPSQWRDMLVNQLESPAMESAGELAELRDALGKALPLPVHMSGSGSTLFVLCDNQAEATDTLERIPKPIQSCCRIVRMNSW
ncbi:MAG: 4-(cytidine 5'-diphospho)-2-C-methyl-D-erythritol kinase [Phycisphaerae bacterium]|nr:4-(cytidine 5'-diphospho)-2-C-methyl-D-erythritol kinase [Phycisphaerae bacterium]